MADVKQTLDQRTGNTPFGQFPIGRRAIGSRSSFVSVKYFHYKKQNFGVPTNTGPGDFTADQLHGVNVGVLEEEIASLKISKNLSGPSGTFELKLHPTSNWKQTLAPGDWVAIYIYDRYKFKDQKGKDDDATNLVMLGNIDRVSRDLQRDDKADKVILQYSVSGRSFGKVFEETDIWFDPHTSQEATVDTNLLRTAGLELTGNPSKMVKAVIDVFLGYGGSFSKGRTDALNQWQIPNELARLFKTTGVKGTPLFFNILKQSIRENMPGFKARNMLSPESSGSVWNMLERSHNSLVNEIFLEEVRDGDGKATPTIVCRPRPLQTPFFDSQFGKETALKSSLKGSFQSLQDLSHKSFLEISPAEIIYENLGKDDHSRLNMYWLRTQQTYEYAYSKTANVDSPGLANPTFSRPSVNRYGLKRLDQVLDFSFAESATGGEELRAPDPNIKLFKAFMAQVYDMNYANHLYDVGTITCSGVLEAELGKALVVLKDPTIKNSKDKIFYIEGYTHEWTFPNMWRTSFTVTHGQFRDANGNIFIDAVGPGDFGSADALISTSYLSKTKTDRK